MKSHVFPLTPEKNAFNLLYCVFSEENIMDLPENSPFRRNYINLQINGDVCSSPLVFKDTIGKTLGNFENYGTISGLYWLWKNVNYPYIGFSLSNSVINISSEELNSFLNSSSDILLITPRRCNCPLQENYRTLYYSFDFRMMLSILKRELPSYYHFAKETWLTSNMFIEPTCIIKQNTLNDFCVWLFPILKLCHTYIKQKHSLYQNRFLEHLSYYLFMLYIKYNEKTINIQFTDSYSPLCNTTNLTTPPLAFDSIKECVQYLLDNRKVETAYKHLLQNKDTEDAIELLPIFEQYERERRYFDSTILEKTHDLNHLMKLCTSSSPSIKTRQPKVLIFKWNSITHNEAVLAFEVLGFECHTFKTGYKSWVYDEDFLDQINRHLDFNSFDMVFSINYFAMVAEACHVHNTPYVAWCYDSPTYIGDYRYLKYSTNHVFMFDSSEAQDYMRRGFDNVHYMPLAVNVDRLDKIYCSAEDISKYSSSVSFVGALYDTNLTKALNYLTDYQKGYLNALVDYQIKTYNYDLFSAILSPHFMDWLSNPSFNKTIRADWEKDVPSEETPSPSSLGLVLNRMVTNRERLLLITMLANHWDFKLYSTGSHEAFNKVIHCGTVEYYQEMPKVFKNSLINLNITFRGIKTGIPQRCLDIMGSHGLLLTNYQKDFDEYFVDQKNLLIYGSIEEAHDKADFYLTHESERKRIECNGYETVCKYFNYPDVLTKILKLSNLEYLLK